jgi:hypothetical protein
MPRAVVAVAGLPGAGKSELTQRLSQRLEARWPLATLAIDDVVEDEDEGEDEQGEDKKRRWTYADVRRVALEKAAVLVGDMRAHDGSGCVRPSLHLSPMPLPLSISLSHEALSLSVPLCLCVRVLLVDDNMHLASMRRALYLVARQSASGIPEPTEPEPTRHDGPVVVVVVVVVVGF